MDGPILQDLVPIPRVWERMEQVETRLVEVSGSDDEFLTGIAQHLITAGGKRYRPRSLPSSVRSKAVPRSKPAWPWSSCISVRSTTTT